MKTLLVILFLVALSSQAFAFECSSEDGLVSFKVDSTNPHGGAALGLLRFEGYIPEEIPMDCRLTPLILPTPVRAKCVGSQSTTVFQLEVNSSGKGLSAELTSSIGGIAGFTPSQHEATLSCK